MIQNDLIIRSDIEHRKREVSPYAEYNKIDQQNRESAASQQESTEQGKNILNLWFLTIAKWLKGVLAINNKDGVKV